EPGGPGVLRLLDAPLHARVPVAGGRARARRAGGRGPDPRRRHLRRLHAVPQGGRDPVQPRVRSEAVTASARLDVETARPVEGGPYYEYLHLVRTSAGWKIANALWRSR